MTIEECYDALDSDYREVVCRLGKEERVEKFLVQFPDDTSYDMLCTALQKENGKEAFRAVHSLKGICMNLGFSNLYQAANALTEALRSGQIPEDAEALFEQVREEYMRTVACIRSFMQA